MRGPTGPVTVEVWLLDVPAELPEGACGPLDEGERRRAGRFATEAGRRRYVAAHLALRQVLSRYTGVAPGELRFGREGRYGRPVLRGAAAPGFSLSHGHGVVAVAVAAGAVCVDVQRVCPPGTVEACLPRLHPWERAELESVAPARRAAEFTRLWARKEAYLKGLGTGLGRPPRADYLGDAAPAARPAGWGVAQVTAPAGYAAAVAVPVPAGETWAVRSVRSALGPA
ncbi:4'-phosphopantetheinyl transferase family protein [Streptomyces omiyaensis]|uniref:4'-phosphopantetheinyl transferase family protein n=1 Tax=Streptomyces omiyaensis TaxID=68247 RepID=UPI001676AFFC|nr:4'-phosphopantetheinyl transferase superfamily protein [Streptomyces omiyaensis]